MMKKFYLSMSVIIMATTFQTGSFAKTADSNSKSLRKIFLLDIKNAQNALDDATGFVAMTPSKKVICFAESNGQWLKGFIETPIMNPQLQTSVCQTINPTGGLGETITDLQNIKVPVATQFFNWKSGGQTNPDEWYTPSGQIPSTTNHGVCISSQDGELGIAVRGQNTPHQCVIGSKNAAANRSVSVFDPSILVLVK